MKHPGIPRVLGWVWDSISNVCYHTGMLLLFLFILGTKALTSSSLVFHGFKGQGSLKLLPMIFLKSFIDCTSFMARRFKNLCSLRLFMFDHLVLFSCSSCPSLTHCPSHQTMGSMLTSTNCVSAFVATWSGPHPGLR